MDEYNRFNKDKNNERAKTRSNKGAMVCDAADRLAANCDNILAFLQAVTLKAPQVMAAPLSL